MPLCGGLLCVGLLLTGDSMALVQNIRIAYFLWKKNLRAVMEYRVAFFLQVVGMMVNDSAFVIVWMLFFSITGTVNGWNGWDSLGLLGFGALTFGIAFGFFGGSHFISRYVLHGSLDEMMLSPVPVLLRVLCSKIDTSALGDAFFGVILLVIYLVHLQTSWITALFLICAVIPGVVITLSMSILAQLPSFFVSDGEAVGVSLFRSFLSPSLYPSALFPDGAKIFFTLVIPSTVVAGLPIQIMRSHSWTLLGMIWVLGIFWGVLAVFLFTRALRRYESGNRIGLHT